MLFDSWLFDSQLGTSSQVFSRFTSFGVSGMDDSVFLDRPQLWWACHTLLAPFVSHLLSASVH